MLKLKIPPVAVLLIFAGLIWLIDYLFPNEALNFPFQKWLIGVLFLSGAVIALLGVAEFKKKSTTVNPHKPQNTSGLVDSGIYSFSRNPMYLGLFLVLISWTIYVGNIFGLMVLPLFIWYLNTFQIIPEEEVMEEKFGEDFREYKKRVRRWV